MGIDLFPSPVGRSIFALCLLPAVVVSCGDYLKTCKDTAVNSKGILIGECYEAGQWFSSNLNLSDCDISTPWWSQRYVLYLVIEPSLDRYSNFV